MKDFKNFIEDRQYYIASQHSQARDKTNTRFEIKFNAPNKRPRKIIINHENGPNSVTIDDIEKQVFSKTELFGPSHKDVSMQIFKALKKELTY